MFKMQVCLKVVVMELYNAQEVKIEILKKLIIISCGKVKEGNK